MTVTKIESVAEALERFAIVAEYNAGYHYNQEAEADSIGEPSIIPCMVYHGQQAKLWEETTKKLREQKSAHAVSDGSTDAWEAAMVDPTDPEPEKVRTKTIADLRTYMQAVTPKNPLIMIDEFEAGYAAYLKTEKEHRFIRTSGATWDNETQTFVAGVPLEEVFTWREELGRRAYEEFGRQGCRCSMETYNKLSGLCNRVGGSADKAWSHLNSFKVSVDNSVPDGLLAPTKGTFSA